MQKTRIRKIVVSIAWIMLGATLALIIPVVSDGKDLAAVGYTLMVVGALGLLISLIVSSLMQPKSVSQLTKSNSSKLPSNHDRTR